MKIHVGAENHAVVIGGSLGGLLAARVLSETFDRVTVVDRDEMPTEPVHRKGVPQSRHTHGLLAKGFDIFEDLLPGLGVDLLHRGAIIDDLQKNIIWYNDGYKLRRDLSSLTVLLTSRPLLETYVRARVGALPQVTILPETEALGLQEDSGRITGVLVSDADGTTTLSAQIVVDATGRSSRGPAWLSQLGYPEIDKDVVRANIVYVSREYRRIPGNEDFTGIIHSHYPGNPIGGGTLAMDGNRWLVTMLGMNDDVPAVVPSKFEDFASRLQGTELHRLVATAEPITEPTRFRIGPSVRHRYERCARLPEGYIAVGDSLCCFNPAYGQGITAAAMSANWLRDCVRTGGLDGLTHRYFKGVPRILDVPWDISVGNDLRFPEVEGRRTVRLKVLSTYLARLHRAATTDTVVGETFLKVANFITHPQSLLSPSMLWRIWRGQRGVAVPVVRTVPRSLPGAIRR